MSQPTSAASAPPSRAIGLACIAAGVYPLALACGLLPLRAGHVYAPRPVLAAAGLTFVIAGVLAGRWVADRGRLARVLGALLLTLFGGIGGWIALYAPAAGFRSSVSAGGIAIGAATPTGARVAFGVGSVLVLGWAAVTWWRVATGSAPRDDASESDRS